MHKSVLRGPLAKILFWVIPVNFIIEVIFISFDKARICLRMRSHVIFTYEMNVYITVLEQCEIIWIKTNIT